VSMDPLFDRLGRLVRSMGVDTSGRKSTTSSDPYEQEAAEELEEFLRTGRDAPRRPNTQGSRPAPGAQRQSTQEPPRQAPPRPPLNPAVAQAYAVLGVGPDAPWDEINAAHRALLKKHHPDRHAGNPTLIQQATAESQKINEAHQLLKKHLGR